MARPIDNELVSVQNRICGICALNTSKYSCPRCNVCYCSLDCFKTHGEQCTEGFYRDQCVEQIKANKIDLETKIDFQQLMKKMQEEEREKALEDERNFLIAKLQNLALEKELTVQDLGPRMQIEFFDACNNGQMSKYVTPWNPWWIKAIPESQPPLPLKLKSFDELSRTPPSETLPFILSNILFAYTCCIMCFNGDWKHDESGVLSMFLELTPTIKENYVPVDFYFSIESFTQSYMRVKNIFGIETLTPEIVIPIAIKMFERHNSTIIRSLQHIKVLLKNVRKTGASHIDGVRLSSIAKRITYFQSWISSSVERMTLAMWGKEMLLMLQKYSEREEKGHDIKLAATEV